MLYLDHPFAFDTAGQTATTCWHNHVVDMLLQFLLTHHHERVNRPEFGTPLSRLCFEGNSQELAEVIQFVARAGLQRWLGQAIEIIELNAQPEEATLLVELKYRVQGEVNVREERRRVAFSGGRG